MKLTKKTDYALRVLTSLAERGEGVVIPTRQLADLNGIPLKFLQSVLSVLVKDRFLESLPGAKGGVRLQRNPGKISLLQVVESLEGPMSLMDCMEESNHCGRFYSCRIQSVFGKAQLAVNEILSSSTIEDLLPCPVKEDL